MYFIKENSDKKLFAKARKGETAIHVVHCAETIEELKEDVANIYLVAENVSNHARIHLVTDFSKDEALQQVYNYLVEKEGNEEPSLIAVSEAKV